MVAHLRNEVFVEVVDGTVEHDTGLPLEMSWQDFNDFKSGKKRRIRFACSMDDVGVQRKRNDILGAETHAPECVS